MPETIAAVAMVVLLGWTGALQDRDLGNIEVEIRKGGDTTLTDGEDATIWVTAYDSSGKTLEGVAVTLDGAGIARREVTNSQGRAIFHFTPELHGQNYGSVDVSADYTGSIPVTLTNTIVVNS